MKSPRYILISAAKQQGKDTFFNILNRLYPNKFRGYAYADKLKLDISHFIEKEFGIDVIHAVGQEKELVRPLLIAFGEVWREIDERHWIKETDDQILIDRRNEFAFTAVTKDNRYIDEILYFKEKYPDECVVLNIKRLGGPDATAEEKKSLPLIEPHIDYRIEWPTVGDDKLDELNNYVIDFYNKYFN